MGHSWEKRDKCLNYHPSSTGVFWGPGLANMLNPVWTHLQSSSDSTPTCTARHLACVLHSSTPFNTWQLYHSIPTHFHHQSYTYTSYPVCFMPSINLKHRPLINKLLNSADLWSLNPPLAMCLQLLLTYHSVFQDSVAFSSVQFELVCKLV